MLLDSKKISECWAVDRKIEQKKSIEEMIM